MEARVPKLHPDPDTEQTVEELTADSPKTQHDVNKLKKSSLETGSNNEKKSAEPPSGVSSAMWQKFQALQSKRVALTKESTEKRAKEVQQEVLSQVKKHFSNEDLEALKKYNVSTDDGPSKPLKRHLKESDDKEAPSEPSQGPTGSEDWSSVKKYIDVNKHLSVVERGRHAPKTKLETKIDAAISRGDYAAAETLSDDLATRDFGKKIADAFDARSYSEQKQKEETIMKDRKKRKIAWRFDHKEKWETKGNM